MEFLELDFQKALAQLSLSTGYSIVQVKGQRKLGGPPPGWRGPPPPRGSEVFVGRIPHHLDETHLFPVFQRMGRIYELRLLLNFSGFNRGYGFVSFADPAEAKRAVAQLDGFEILPGKKIAVKISVDNCRLFIGGIPKTVALDEVAQVLRQLAEGIVNVTAYPNHLERKENRGYAFLQFESHQAAIAARRQLKLNSPVLWGSKLIIDWADPECSADDEEQSMSSTTLHVRNLTLSTTDTELRRLFSTFCQTSSCVVDRIRDFAFVRFADRETARMGLTLNGTKMHGSAIEVQWARSSKRKAKLLNAKVPGSSSPGASSNPSRRASPALSPPVNAADPDPAILSSRQSRGVTRHIIPMLVQLRNMCTALGFGVPFVEILAIRCGVNMSELRYGAKVGIPNARPPLDHFICPTLCSTVEEVQECGFRYVFGLLSHELHQGSRVPH